MFEARTAAPHPREENPHERYRTLNRHDHDGVASISFDHPPINLVDRELVIDLLNLVKALEGDAQTRVVIFGSANPEFFLAHYDLGSQLGQPAPALPQGQASLLSALFGRYSRLPQVTIGALRGHGRGAGSEFLLALVGAGHSLRFEHPCRDALRHAGSALSRALPVRSTASRFSCTIRPPGPSGPLSGDDS